MAFGQGSLTPPGAPGATMKTLDELDVAIAGVNNAVSAIQDEARTPISTASCTIDRSESYYLTDNLMPEGGDVLAEWNVVSIKTNLKEKDLAGVFDIPSKMHQLPVRDW